MTAQEIWNNWYFQDGLVLLLVLLLARVVQVMRTREYWRAALRQVFRRALIRNAFIILCLYAAVALLDSVGYHPALRDDTGTIRRDPATGQAITDARGLTVLDLILTPLRTAREKSYSAPFATHGFSREAMLTESGEKVRDYPPLAFPGRHILGTDRTGNDVLYLALKSIRTGMIIGGLTTLLAIPLAILFGVMAGYFGGWIDDLVQYLYTTLASIPSVLLIAAFMVIQIPGMPQLLKLCLIMGITSWTGLCRVLRGETMKLREMDYVQAAEAIGLSRARIMVRHIVPNLMHIVLITGVLSFSGRVLAEAVLTYIGIGIGADTMSWGVMINDALREMARDPVIWWKLFAVFVFMLGLVLPANLFGDALRDALDPRLRSE